MRTTFFFLWVSMLLAVPWGQCLAQDVAITSSDRGGMLSWGGTKLGTTCRVEWASSLTEPGMTNWNTLTNLVVTNQCVMVSPVPMFYRVVGVPCGAHIAGYSGDADWRDKHLAEDGDWDTASAASHSNRELLGCHPYNGAGPRYWRFKYSSSGSEWMVFSCYDYDSGTWTNIYSATSSASGQTVTPEIPSACLSSGQLIRLRVWSCDPPSRYYEGEVVTTP